MRRILAGLLVATLVVTFAAPAADARGGHGPGNVVIGLAAFALFAPLVIVGEVLAHTVPYLAPAVVVAPPPVYYAPAPTYYAPTPVYSTPPPVARSTYAAAPAQPTVVQYPHGRHVLRGDGVTTAYQWVWIPNPPPPPPPPARPASYQ
jgi:hypothetical protein